MSQASESSAVPAVRVASQTDVGQVRQANEDSFLEVTPQDPAVRAARGTLVAVADGMGGTFGGATASTIVVSTLRDIYYSNPDADIPTALGDAIRGANTAVHDFAQENPAYSRMGATCTAVAIIGRSAYFGHVGDTRCYLVRDGGLLQLTQDHSKVAQLARDGFITPEQAETHPEKNVLLRVLGPKPVVEPDVTAEPYPLQYGDVLVLCSDGLTGHVSDREILDIVDHQPVDQAVSALIAQANGRGGQDNITVQLVQIGERQLGGTTTGPRGGPRRAPPTIRAEAFEIPKPGERKRPPLALAAVIGLIGIVVGVGLAFGLTGSSKTDPEHPDPTAVGRGTLDAQDTTEPVRTTAPPPHHATPRATNPRPGLGVGSETSVPLVPLLSPSEEKKAIKALSSISLRCPSLLQAVKDHFGSDAPADVVQAIARIQSGHALKADGILGPDTGRAAKNEPFIRDLANNDDCRCLLYPERCGRRPATPRRSRPDNTLKTETSASKDASASAEQDANAKPPSDKPPETKVDEGAASPSAPPAGTAQGGRAQTSAGPAAPKEVSGTAAKPSEEPHREGPDEVSDNTDN